MTFEEKKSALMGHKTEKMYWQVILGLQVLSLLNGAYSIIQYFMHSAVGGFLGGAAIIVILIAFAINAWIAWGVYRLERWVKMWMWIAVIGSALSFNILGLILSILVLIGYMKVLKVVFPKTASSTKS